MSVIYYRTQDGRADYQFTIEFQSQTDGYRVYILSQPGYCGRNEHVLKTHRLTTGSRKHIGWPRPIESETTACRIAAEWSDRTQIYIHIGHDFEHQDELGPRF